ncbi:MAG: hypothetical protein ABSD28_20235, partial [Tepidisphaeraceae bacterium]
MTRAQKDQLLTRTVEPQPRAIGDAPPDGTDDGSAHNVSGESDRPEHGPYKALLYADQRPMNATWVPVHATGTESRSRVLVQALYWFEPAFADERRQERGAANVTSGDGHRRRQTIVNDIDAVGVLLATGLRGGRFGNRGIL